MSQNIVVDLRISAREYQKMYAGVASSVFVVARDGRRVRFPASLLRRFVRSDGVVGTFMFELDSLNKVRHLHRLER